MQDCYCIDVMETAHKHAAIAPELLAIDSLTGCDSVAPTYGVGKATAIAVTKKGFKLGNTTVDVSEIRSQTTTFMAACYGEGTGCSTILRWLNVVSGSGH